MTDADLRLRVQRILRGDFRPEDLTRLFLYARQCSNGSKPVRDVGNFVAHKDLRNQGLVTEATKDWFIMAWYYFLIQQGGVNFASLPADFGDFLTATFQRADNQTIKRKTGGMTKTRARKVLPQLISNMKNNDGSFSLKTRTREEDLLSTFSLAN